MAFKLGCRLYLLSLKMKFFLEKSGGLNVRRSVCTATWKQNSLLPFLESVFTWPSCYCKLNCFHMISMDALHRLASPHHPQCLGRWQLEVSPGRSSVTIAVSPAIQCSAVHHNKVSTEKHPAIWTVMNLSSVLTPVPKLKILFYLLVLSTGILVYPRVFFCSGFSVALWLCICGLPLSCFLVNWPLVYLLFRLFGILGGVALEEKLWSALLSG